MIISVPYAKSMAGHTSHITLMTVISITLIVLLSKGMGAQVAHKEMDQQISTIQIRESAKGQILLRLFTRK